MTRNGKANEKHRAHLVLEYRGILQVIGPGGNIETYRQKGIGQIPYKHIELLLECGKLDRKYVALKDFPRNYTLVVDEPQVWESRVTATFPYKSYKAYCDQKCPV